METPASLVEPVPFRTDEMGTIRIGESRVTLDVVAHLFRSGATAEQIVDQFPVLALADVYAVITWMLRHPDELKQYSATREKEAESIRAEVEALCPPDALRARLLARKQVTGN